MPTFVGENGYRYYDDECLVRLQEILLFRELEFPLKKIKELMDSPDYDRSQALADQIRWLELKKLTWKLSLIRRKPCREDGK